MLRVVCSEQLWTQLDGHQGSCIGRLSGHGRRWAGPWHTHPIQTVLETVKVYFY